MKHYRTAVVVAAFALACSGRHIKREMTLLPGDHGLNTQALKAALDSAQEEKVNLHSIVIERRGKIVAEFYGTGSDRTMAKRYGMGNPFAGATDFDASMIHDVRSVSKSITSLLYGLEKYRKQIPGIETAVLSTYPQMNDLATAERKDITFYHLLTMTSGLEWHEWGKSFITSDETRLLWKSDPARFVFDKPVIYQPGLTFQYSGGNTTVIADVLSRSTGKPLLEIARDDFFNPLGISDWDWTTDSDGRPLAHAGLRLRPRDMVKIGRLILQKGKWEGKQLISSSWIEQSIQTHAMTGIDFFSGHGEKLGYGFQWWTGSSPSKNGKVQWVSAVGNGGQRICIVPSFNLVIVTTAGDYGEIEIQRRIGRIIDEIISAVQ